MLGFITHGCTVRGQAALQEVSARNEELVSEVEALQKQLEVTRKVDAAKLASLEVRGPLA